MLIPLRSFVRYRNFAFTLLALLFSLGAQCQVTPRADASESAHKRRRLKLYDGFVKKKQYWLGGALAIFPGFGIGHNYQGRYVPQGAIFTAGELVAVTGIVVIPVLICGGAMQPDVNCVRSTQNISLGVLAAFKAWEIFDIFAGTKIRPDEDSVEHTALSRKWNIESAVLPVAGGGGVAVVGIKF